MSFYKHVSGARLHAAHLRPGGASFDLPHGLLADVLKWATQFNTRINEVEEVVTANRIWKSRTVGIAPVTAQQALAYEFSAAGQRREVGSAQGRAVRQVQRSKAGWPLPTPLLTVC